MDQKEMMERLKRDPAALQAVMQSQDGQMLLRLLSGSDGGRTLQQAVRQAAAGDACFPLHKWASADFLPACRRYWVGVIPVRFLKARAK